MADKVKVKRVLGYCGSGDGARLDIFKGFTDGKDVKKEGFKDVDCVVLWGGTDIHPSLYNHRPHPMNGAPALPSARDIFEHKTVLYCRANNIPLIGICRGAQLLCAEAGGTLVQHCLGHGYDHMMDTNTGKTALVTSTHHQMMNPFSVPHVLIGWALGARSFRYEGEGREDIEEMHNHQEPEIVYFPGIRGLAIQGHPEYAHASTPFVDLCNELIETYLFPKKGLSS